jgi:hypothetical protein
MMVTCCPCSLFSALQLNPEIRTAEYWIAQLELELTNISGTSANYDPRTLVAESIAAVPALFMEYELRSIFQFDFQ